MRFHSCRPLFLPAVALVLFSAGVLEVRATPAPTTTTLTITSGGSAASSVASGSKVTLTTAVVSGSTKVTIGQVNFCDASATYCTDIHLLGTAQLTGAGTAVISLRPGIGSRSYKAVFVGTPNGTPAYARSVSAATALTVTGTFPTTTAIAASGSAGNYTLTATVTGEGSAALPTGSLSFLDTSRNNAPVGTAPLGADTESLSFLSVDGPGLFYGYPSYIAEGDFNGDGFLDLAVTNEPATTDTPSTVAIQLGEGNGQFSQGAPSLTVNTDPIVVAVSDFNSDGKADLAVAYHDGATLTILLGNGDGTFTATATSPVALNSSSIAVGDFNGDGIQDLAVTDDSNNDVTILLGNGDGTFTPAPANPPTGIGPQFVAVGDFNGDGKLDLAVGETLDVRILLGNGDGTFSYGSSLPVSAPVNWIAVGDFTGNGVLDLAAAPSFAILLGNGDGTFTQGATPDFAGSVSKPFLIGDFNGDGKVDLAANYSWYFNGIGILLGNGDGTFQMSANPANASEPISGVAGDFNGDGITDVVVPGSSNGEIDMATLLSQPTQTATATATGISPVGTGTHQIDATYPGDILYGTSVSAMTPLIAEPAVPASLNSPTPGSVLTGTSVLFTWTAGTGATGYSLWLGSTGVGTSNLYNSHETAATSVAATGLPTTGGTIYARLNTIINGTSTHIDYTYTAATLAQAALTLPAPGGTLTGSSVTFTWTGAADATGYSLWIGNTGVGSSNLYNSHSTTATSVVASGLPTTGETIYVRLNVITNGASTHVDYTYTAATLAQAALTLPAPGSTLTSSSVTFTWTPSASTTGYSLWIGSTGVGSSNLYNSHATTATSVVASGLPANGETIYVRLNVITNGASTHVDYTYTAQ